MKDTGISRILNDKQSVYVFSLLVLTGYNLYHAHISSYNTIYSYIVSCSVVMVFVGLAGLLWRRTREFTVDVLPTTLATVFVFIAILGSPIIYTGEHENMMVRLLFAIISSSAWVLFGVAYGTGL